MLISRRQIPLLWIALLIIVCVLHTVVAKPAKKKIQRRDDDDDDDDDHDYDHDDDHDDDDDHHYDDDHDDYDDDDDHHDHDDHDDDEEEHKGKPVGDDPKEPPVPIEAPEFTTPQNPDWLKDVDFSKITGKVRPIGSGICKNAKCDGSDNEKCFESCGNMATPDDVYGCQDEKTWALTFDDGPSNYTMELLDILEAHKIKATFVVMGAHAKQFPHVIKRAFSMGHQIASHTYSHPHLMSLTNEQIVYEIRATEEVIKEAIGVKPKFVRPPYGEADTRVKGILKQLGYKVLMWNVDPTDYNVHMLPDGGERIVRAFEKALDGSKNPLNAHNDKGFISLQHDLFRNSILQVPPILDRLLAKQYKLMTAAECIGDDAPHAKYAVDPVNAQSVDAQHQEVQHADSIVNQVQQQQQQSSANSLVGSTVMSLVLAVSGFISYFI